MAECHVLCDIVILYWQCNRPWALLITSSSWVAELAASIIFECSLQHVMVLNGICLFLYLWSCIHRNSLVYTVCELWTINLSHFCDPCLIETDYKSFIKPLNISTGNDHKGAFKYYVSQLSLILDPPPPPASALSARALTPNLLT